MPSFELPNDPNAVDPSAGGEDPGATGNGFPWGSVIGGLGTAIGGLSGLFNKPPETTNNYYTTTEEKSGSSSLPVIIGIGLFAVIIGLVIFMAVKKRK